MDDKRNPVEYNDLPHLIASWKHYRQSKGLPSDNFIGDKFSCLLKKQYPRGINITTDYHDRTKSVFIVPKMDIATDKYDLSINRYKEVIYDIEEYEDPKTIIKRLQNLESKILVDLNELERLL